MKKFISTAAVLFLLADIVNPQGCIVVRNVSGYGQFNLTDNSFSVSNWQLNITNRYFKAFRDFKGTVNQNTPKQDENVIRSFSTDFTLIRLLRNGWSFTLSLPISSNSRTTTGEHGGAGTSRHTTTAFGVGDIRFTVNKWLLEPAVRQKGNIQVGLGVKLPTGDYKYQDYFYKDDTTKILAPVNVSIQLGDGGTGIITELNAYYFVAKTISIYGNFYYLINPRDENGVSTTTWRTATALQISTGGNVYSVPDIYSIRTGANITMKKFSLSAGLRLDGEPVHDLFGESNGIRRPGHNLSVEPGISFIMNKTSFYVFVPVLVSRKIRQNVPDALASEKTGIYRMGSGGSGNYQVFAGVQFKF